jgi:hypothetical protein
MAAWFLDMLWYFYLVRNHKIVENSSTIEAREENQRSFGILQILGKFRKV